MATALLGLPRLGHRLRLSANFFVQSPVQNRSKVSLQLKLLQQHTWAGSSRRGVGDWFNDTSYKIGCKCQARFFCRLSISVETQLSMWVSLSPSLSLCMCVCCEFMARSKDNNNNNTSNEFLWAHTHPTLSYPFSAILKDQLAVPGPSNCSWSTSLCQSPTLSLSFSSLSADVRCWPILC